MPGQPGSEKRIRNHIVQVRVDDGELARLKALAKGSGLTRAEVLRRSACRTKIRAYDTDQIVTSISRVGNVLNQLARVAHSTGKLPEREAIQAALRQLRDVMRDLDQ